MATRYRSLLLGIAIATLHCWAFSQQQWIFSAMKDEMARTMSSLQIDTLRPPYYLAYAVTESESYSIKGSMGSLLSFTETPRSRSINVQMRVGSPSFDNTNFISFGSFGRSGVAYVSPDGSKYTTYEDDYAALRRDLWLATDAVYKRVVADLSKKKATLQQRVRTDTTADFSPAKPYTTIGPPTKEKFDRGLWEEKTKRLSAVMKKFPEIQYSEVNTGLADDFTYYLNSEGSQNTHQKTRVWIEVTARTQATDGMPVSNFASFYGNSLSDVPAEQELVRQIETIARESTALRSASILDSYSGPVLFENQAAAELVAQGLGLNLCNSREPTSDSPQLERMRASQLGDLPFQNKIGVRILPEFLSVSDDPTKKTYQGIPLISSFTVDDEGVQAHEVKLVEKGVLKTLLTSRTPHKRISESNGHARGYPPQAFFSNLFLTTKDGKTEAQLKEQLISICKERGLPFGIIIRKINNPYFRQQVRDQADFFSFGAGGQSPFVLDPMLVYKLFPDGKEELIRGMELSGMTTQSFKEILSASQSEFIYNHLTSQKGSSVSGLFNPGQARVCVVTPSLLFESADLKRTSIPFRTPPISSHPVFGK